MAAITHDTGGGKWRRALIDRLRRLHLPVGSKATADRRCLGAGDTVAAEASVRRHLQGTLAAAKNIRSGHSRIFPGG